MHLPLRRTRVVSWLLVPAALAGLVLVQTWLFRRSTCETFDEFTYLWMGISVFRQGNFFNLCSPMTPPLPILLEYWWPCLTSTSLPETPGWDLEVPTLIRQARLLTSVTLGVPLVWTVYGWLWARRGWAVGAIGGGLTALSPTVLAASSIATTDACFALFGVLGLASLHRYQARPGVGSFGLLGLALGLALASKQTAAILLPVASIVLFEIAWRGSAGTTSVDRFFSALFRSGIKAVALVTIAFGVDWALYGFTLGPRFDSMSAHAFIPVFVPMVADLLPNGEAIMAFLRASRPPMAIDTFIGQLDHASFGHPAFLMGQHSSRGWWSFFPIALALKSTPGELVLFGISAGLALRPRTWRDPTRRLWLGTVVVLVASGICSSINIGQRYMLLAYPLIILMGVDAIGSLRPGRAWLVGGLLLAWQLVSAVGIAPHYLSYFNGIRGGPEQGYRNLVDSSLDWGQDLPALRLQLEARGYRKVALAYFGTASPTAYGLRSMGTLDAEDPIASGCDWLAISATTFQGAYSHPSMWADHFEALPSIRVAYTIFLYDLRDPRVRSALGKVRRIARDRPESVPDPHLRTP